MREQGSGEGINTETGIQPQTCYFPNTHLYSTAPDAVRLDPGLSTFLLDDEPRLPSLIFFFFFLVCLLWFLNCFVEVMGTVLIGGSQRGGSSVLFSRDSLD